MAIKRLRFDGLGESIASMEQYARNENLQSEMEIRAKRKKLVELIKKVASTELTEKQRTAFELYFFENMTMTEIAKMQGKNKSTVSREIKAAERRIRKYLKYFFSSFYYFES